VHVENRLWPMSHWRRGRGCHLDSVHLAMGLSHPSELHDLCLVGIVGVGDVGIRGINVSKILESTLFSRIQIFSASVVVVSPASANITLSLVK
jgi:hypothetical protein